MRRVAAGVAALLVTAALAACSRGESPLAGCHLPSGATVLAIGDSLTRGQGGDGSQCMLLVLDEGDGAIVDATLDVVHPFAWAAAS